MNNNEGYLEREKRRLAEDQVRLEKMNAHARTYNTLLDRGSDYLEQAYDSYMGGDRVEDWESVERWVRAAVADFRSCVDALYKLAEISPSDVQPESYKSMEDLIRRTNDVLLNYHQRWGKRLIKEERDKVMALERWTCASLQVAGIPHADMESVAGETYCRDECRFRKICDKGGL